MYDLVSYKCCSQRIKRFDSEGINKNNSGCCYKSHVASLVSNEEQTLMGQVLHLRDIICEKPLGIESLKSLSLRILLTNYAKRMIVSPILKFRVPLPTQVIPSYPQLQLFPISNNPFIIIHSIFIIL